MHGWGGAEKLCTGPTLGNRGWGTRKINVNTMPIRRSAIPEELLREIEAVHDGDEAWVGANLVVGGEADAHGGFVGSLVDALV